MVQTFQGYFKEGRFVSSQSVEIPEFVEVYIVVTSKTIPAAHPVIQSMKQVKTAKKKTSTEEALNLLSRFKGCIRSEDLDYENERDERLNEKYGHTN